MRTARDIASGKVCVGDVQPFTDMLSDEDAENRSVVPEGRSGLPPVVPPLPGATPRR